MGTRLLFGLHIMLGLLLALIAALPKVNLDRAYIFGGKFFGPGEADVPQELADALKARQQKEQGTIVPEQSSTLHTLPDDFPGAGALREAGFTTIEQVQTATDNQLNSVKGIGTALLKQIREAAKE